MAQAWRKPAPDLSSDDMHLDKHFSHPGTVEGFPRIFCLFYDSETFAHSQRVTRKLK